MEKEYNLTGMVGVKDIADILYGIENKGTVSIVDANGKKTLCTSSSKIASMYMEWH